MKTYDQIKASPGLTIIDRTMDGGSAYWRPTKNTRPAVIVWSYGDGWDHVSVSFKSRCPTWDEMCEVKNMFFEEQEWAIQYHPAKDDYINCHPYCLHIWKPQQLVFPKPPKYMIGI